jgi:hypothetical protein
MKKYSNNFAGLNCENHDKDRDGNIVIHNETSWLLLGLSWEECRLMGNQRSIGRQIVAEEVNSVANLLSPEVEVVVILPSHLVQLFEQSAAALFDAAETSESTVTVLIRWEEPPLQNIRYDGKVSSFWCTTSVFRNLLNIASIGSLDTLCFDMLHAILNGKIDVHQLSVKQLPVRERKSDLLPLDRTAALIMAHRGKKSYLDVALTFIKRAASSSGLKVTIGLDVDDIDEYRSVSQSFQDFKFYHVAPTPAGPYVVRQKLIDHSAEDILVFQDSDDISCYDRLVVQYAEMHRTKADLIGCHQIRVDEINKCVEAFRFPLDISAALSVQNSVPLTYQAQEPLLHATAMTIREGLIDAGGFSTDQKIANDTQFMLRAYFTLRMRNVDAFLYIQRRHAEALTVSENTALGIPLRQHLGGMWAADFEAVKSGETRLELTSLVPRHGAGNFSFMPLQAGHSEDGCS